MKHTKLLSIVEDILNEKRAYNLDASHLWDTPKVFRNASDANKELKKFPLKLRKYFKVAPDDTRPAGILTTDEFHKKAKKVDKFTYELEGFEIGIEDGQFPDYIKPTRKEKNEDILAEAKNVWRQPPRGKYKNEAHATKEIKKMPRKLQKFFTIKSIDGPSYGVEVEATDKFHDKSETIDSNIDYFVYELEGFEIGLIDGHYPEYISIFNEAEWR